MNGFFFWTMVVCALILGGSFMAASYQLSFVPPEPEAAGDEAAPSEQITVVDISAVVQRISESVKKTLAENVDREPDRGAAPSVPAPVEKETAEPVCELMNGPSLEIGQTATLTAHDPQAQINVREEPLISARAPHYGLVGDSVRILGEFWSARGCWKWFQVEFAGSKARGWVRGDLLR